MQSLHIWKGCNAAPLQAPESLCIQIQLVSSRWFIKQFPGATMRLGLPTQYLTLTLNLTQTLTLKLTLNHPKPNPKPSPSPNPNPNDNLNPNPNPRPNPNN